MLQADRPAIRRRLAAGRVLLDNAAGDVKYLRAATWDLLDDVETLIAELRRLRDLVGQVDAGLIDELLRGNEDASQE